MVKYAEPLIRPPSIKAKDNTCNEMKQKHIVYSKM